MGSKNFFSLSEVDFSLGAGDTVMVSAHCSSAQISILCSFVSFVA